MDLSDDNDEEIASWKGVPGVVVLLNVFDKNTATVAHVATCRMLRHYLRSSSSVLLGVCLYGTEDVSVSAFGTKSVIDLIPLTAPNLNDFKKFREVDVSSYEPPKELKMSDALGACSIMFRNCKKQLLSRTIIILTRIDVAPIDQKPTLIRVRDLVDFNTDIRIINIAEDEYEAHEFYTKFLKEANKGKDIDIPKPIWDAKEIEKIMHLQSHRNLAVAKLKFQIEEGFAIGVAVYKLSTKTQHKKTNLDRTDNAVVKSTTKAVKVCKSNNDETSMEVDDGEDSGLKTMPLLKSETLYYQEFGGERVEFTDAEMKMLKNPFGPPMIKLLGFKPTDIMCKEKWFLKTGYFLFPNDSIIEGSTVAFKAMHQACVETKMVAISVLSTRVNAKPSIVALAPCTHPLGLDVEIGFDVIHIPFVENVRDLPEVEDDEETGISREQKGLMKDMLETLKFDYKSDMFENPKLQCEYRAVEAIALEEDDLEPFVDTTKPSNDRLEDIHADSFEELFGPFEISAPKRSIPKDSGGNPKKAKTEDFDESTLKYRVESQSVDKYTVAQLRDVLRLIVTSEKLALNGLKKSQLVELVYKHYK
ncbi:X-ray repair cross-complementing protein 6-like [Hyposmocoma kahamanoa]|uniref:X-ray repair cross-complementing protein 6-like n=1 Tax=Hyposmocoma kahamanoa TaxID=1477025 RepID=UPI000E6D72F0|nr:X-ray repair cross-complementing protein 6-like [Hyposmocoma kahamanoa]